ncbi:hypothetical protein NLI96_g12018 [Meripilus lineatus]|uniref:Uncharacterized protein n=1 Tax=Meripilus lineatus TaxID=2056292 RepID=A0AAD5YAA5_9APHY|nr:hypothetical protein NLI96_g12018 [Physisporinus lineatus]
MAVLDTGKAEEEPDWPPVLLGSDMLKSPSWHSSEVWQACGKQELDFGYLKTMSHREKLSEGPRLGLCFQPVDLMGVVNGSAAASKSTAIGS